MLLLLGTATGVMMLGAIVVSRYRARHRWVSPYTNLASAMRVVTRTEASEFRPAGLVALRPAVTPPTADVVDLDAVRRDRVLTAV